jgi:hypothetical protein
LCVIFSLGYSLFFVVIAKEISLYTYFILSYEYGVGKLFNINISSVESLVTVFKFCGPDTINIPPSVLISGTKKKMIEYIIIVTGFMVIMLGQINQIIIYHHKLFQMLLLVI